LPGSGWALLVWVLVLAAAITLVETLSAKLQLFEVPQLLATAFLFAASSIAVRLFGDPLL
jgi:formate hydrogenlyase subunit 4